MLDRRDVLRGAGSLTLAAGAFVVPARGGAVNAATADEVNMDADTGMMRFRVDRGGSRMGTHELRFERRDDHHVKVAIDIDLAVKFGPFTVFRYTHRNRTVWSDGRILRMSTRTDDDGTKYEVEATRGDDGDLIVTTRESKTTARGEILPTTYWMQATPQQSELLNTQKGNVASVRVTDLGTRRQKTPTGPVTAQGYKMAGDVQAEMWYGPDGRWVGLGFDAKGERVIYTLERREGFLPTTPDLTQGA